MTTSSDALVPARHLRRAVFFDRDGTLVEEAGYLNRVERMRWFPFAIDALRVLHRAGYALVIVTNQAGVARGFFTEDTVREIHATMARDMAAAGVPLARAYYCPHHPDAALATQERYRVDCDCRKPRTGMVTRAAEELGLDLTRSWVVGDRWIDVALAVRTGGRGILVRTGYGDTESGFPPDGIRAEAIVDHVFDAASLIVRSAGSADQPLGGSEPA